MHQIQAPAQIPHKAGFDRSGGKGFIFKGGDIFINLMGDGVFLGRSIKGLKPEVWSESLWDGEDV